MAPLTALAAAAADCERIGRGVLDQPVNALSSAAFLLAGLWVAGRGIRATGRRTELVVFGLAVALNALGGFLFHAFGGQGALWVHDVSIVAMLGFVVAFDAARLLGRSTGWTLGAFGIGLASAGVLLFALPVASYAVFGLVGTAAGAGELAEYRHEIPAIRREGLTARRLARLSVVAVVLLAAGAFFVGRTGAPLCDPSSPFQWHAVWHVLAALGIGLYAYGAIEPHPGTAAP